MTDTSFFVEKQESLRLRHDRRGIVEQSIENDQGFGISRIDDSNLSYRWVELSQDDRALVMLPTSLLAEARLVLGEQALAANTLASYDNFVRSLLLTARENGAEQLAINVLELHQHILHATDGTIVKDYRRAARLLLRIWTKGSSNDRSVFRTYTLRGGEQYTGISLHLQNFIADIASIAQKKQLQVSCPTGRFPIVLAPGPSAHFFHEVVGRPLEGDVVVRHASYLAPLLGQRISDECLTIIDDPFYPSSPANYAVDDEGVKAEQVILIHEGRVGSPILDQLTARRLQRASNGHARRTNFRYYALPRLSHTYVKPHVGALKEIISDVPYGLLLLGLRLRHMDIAIGDFSFYIDEAREIRQGKLGPFVSSGLLVGNGYDALREIDRVGADIDQAPLGTSGNGKLDQGPLTVSFTQPTVRFRNLHIEAVR